MTQKQAPLTDDEIAYVRSVIAQDKNVRWFWSTVKTWSLAVIAIVGAATVGFDLFIKSVKAALGK